MAQDGAVLHT